MLPLKVESRTRGHGLWIRGAYLQMRWWRISSLAGLCNFATLCHRELWDRKHLLLFQIEIDRFPINNGIKDYEERVKVALRNVGSAWMGEHSQEIERLLLFLFLTNALCPNYCQVQPLQNYFRNHFMSVSLRNVETEWILQDNNCI